MIPSPQFSEKDTIPLTANPDIQRNPMKAYHLTGAGFGNLSCIDEDIAPPAVAEVQVRIKAAAINYRDLGVALGHYPAAPNLVPMSDGAGTVEAVGDGVEDFAVGDEVVSCFYENWPSGRASAANHKRSLGSERDGVLAEIVNLPGTALIAKPANLDFTQAATLPCAATTAWSALFTEGRLQPGDHVVIEGTGGVGIFALQFAKMADATVTMLSGSDEKLEQAKALGADHLVNYNAKENWSDAVMEKTGGTGADVVIELGGPATLAQALKSIRVDGLVAVIGVLSGLEASVFVPDILQRHARLQGITVGSREEMMAMARAIAASGLTPVVDTSYGFDDALQAYQDLPKGEHFGKLVVDFTL